MELAPRKPEADRTYESKDIFSSSAKIDGPVLAALWRNLIETGVMIDASRVAESILSPDRISEAVNESINVSTNTITPELKAFLRTKETKDLYRKLNGGIELDISKVTTESVKGINKVVQFLYYRQQGINIANFGDIPEKAEPQTIESILPSSVLTQENRLEYCLKSSGLFNLSEINALVDFAKSKVRVSAVVSYLLAHSSAEKYNDIWNTFFGKKDAIGMRYYDKLLSSAEKIHVSLKDGIDNDLIPGLGYVKKDGKLVRKMIELPSFFKDGKTVKRKVDSRTTVLTGHKYVLPMEKKDGDLAQYIDQFIPGMNINEQEDPDKHPGLSYEAVRRRSLETRKLAVLQMIKAGFVNSMCDPLEFNLVLDGKFDSGLLNQVADRNVAYPAGIISRFSQTVYVEDGNDRIVIYADLRDFGNDPHNVKKDANVEAIKLYPFWGKTEVAKAYGAGKTLVGNMWPAFGLWHSRGDFFTKERSAGLRKILGIREISIEMSEEDREKEMKRYNVRPISAAPIYTSDNNKSGELKELCVKPMLARAYNLLINDLSPIRAAFTGGPMGSDFITPNYNQSVVDEGTFTPTSILIANESRANFMMSFYPKFAKIYEMFDAASSPGSSGKSLLVPAQIQEVIKLLIFEGSKSESKDKWEKYLGTESYKAPLYIAAYLTIAHATWFEQHSAEIDQLNSQPEQSFLQRLFQVKNIFGLNFFKINLPAESLSVIATYPWIAFAEGLFKKVSGAEKKLVGKPNENNPNYEFYKTVLLSSLEKIFDRNEDKNVASSEAIKFMFDLNAIRNWLDIDKMLAPREDGEPVVPNSDFFPIFGAYFGDIFHDIILQRANAHDNLNLKVLPFVRSKQISLVREYLIMRGVDLKHDLNEFSNPETLEYLTKNGFNNLTGAKLARMMAEDFSEIVDQVSGPSLKSRLDLIKDVFGNTASQRKLDFIRRLHTYYMRANLNINPVDINITSRGEIKVPDGYNGLAPAAYSYRDFCCAMFAAFEYLDTMMSDSYGGEIAGNIVELFDKTRERLNSYRVSGEDQDLNLSELRDVLNNRQFYNDGDTRHRNRVSFFSGGSIVISKDIDTITSKIVYYAKALAPWLPGVQIKYFTDGTNLRLDPREVQTHPSDGEKDVTVQSMLRKAFRAAIGENMNSVIRPLDHAILKVFAGYGESSGKSQTNKVGLRRVFDELTGWETKGLNDEKKLKKKLDEEGEEDDSVHRQGAKESSKKAKDLLMSNIGTANKVVGGAEKLLEAIRFPGKVGLGIGAAILAATVFPLISVPFIAGLPLGVLTLVIGRRIDSNLANTKEGRPIPEEEQHYAYATQRIIIEGLMKGFHSTYNATNPIDRFRHWFSGQALSYLPTDSSLEAEKVETVVDIFANFKLPNKDKNKK